MMQVADIKSFRLIPQLERYPSVVGFCQTIPGKVLLVGIFAYLLQFVSRGEIIWPGIVFAVAICAYAGKYRHMVLPFLALYTIFAYPGILWVGTWFRIGEVGQIPEVVAQQENVTGHVNWFVF